MLTRQRQAPARPIRHIAGKVRTNKEFLVVGPRLPSPNWGSPKNAQRSEFQGKISIGIQQLEVVKSAPKGRLGGADKMHWYFRDISDDPSEKELTQLDQFNNEPRRS